MSKKRKAEAAVEWLVPSAETVQEKYEEKYLQDKQDFLQQVHQTFLRGIEKFQPRFLLHDNLTYQWQREVLQTMFAEQGYELMFYSEPDKYQDQTYNKVDLIVPHTSHLQALRI